MPGTRLTCRVSPGAGVYCGPLRLLAWEMADRLNAAGVPCNTITGQEKRLVEEAQHTAMTVEMADIAQQYDAAVIDEIQVRRRSSWR